MPKVISKSTISASTDVAPTESSTAALRVYYCLCGDFILVINKSLDQLPRRRTDNAIIVRSKDTDGHPACIFKLNSKQLSPVLVQREKGIEMQCRHACPRCNLTVAYQNTVGTPKDTPFLYILQGAVSERQGQIPWDAFEGEEM